MSKYTKTQAVTYEDRDAIIADMTADIQIIFDKYKTETEPGTPVVSLLGSAFNDFADSLDAW